MSQQQPSLFLSEVNARQSTFHRRAFRIAFSAQYLGGGIDEDEVRDSFRISRCEEHGLSTR